MSTLPLFSYQGSLQYAQQLTKAAFLFLRNIWIILGQILCFCEIKTLFKLISHMFDKLIGQKTTHIKIPPWKMAGNCDLFKKKKKWENGVGDDCTRRRRYICSPINFHLPILRQKDGNLGFYFLLRCIHRHDNPQ